MFVGDIFMLPSDPKGKNGPKLEDFLCFPEWGFLIKIVEKNTWSTILCFKINEK